MSGPQLELEDAIADIAAMANLLSRMTDLTSEDCETVNQTAALIQDRIKSIKDIAVAEDVRISKALWHQELLLP